MNRRVLLLQGPLGPFFSRLASDLKSEGHAVFKIHFNGGDEACYAQGGAERYTGRLSDWPAFLTEFIARHQINRIFLFGDCRPYHRRAITVARELDIAVFVFDEGYVRPDYITIEPWGVNGYSSLSRDPDYYRECGLGKPDNPQSAGRAFGPIARQAMRYYWEAWRRRRSFPHYAHHRPLNPIREGVCWIRSGWRKLYYAAIDRRFMQYLTKRAGRYFFVPLQVHCDSQMVHHSGGLTVERFIHRVIRSFAQHAPDDAELVFKHHPMDRAYYDHGGLISLLAKQYGVCGRVHSMHQGHLPTLLRRARGTVTVNSTVGLSSALHRTPVKVAGEAVYDMPGLTCQGSLDEFWQAPGKVDPQLYGFFRRYLVANVLANGNFYKRIRDDCGATGVAWPFGSLSAAMDPQRAGEQPSSIADDKLSTPYAEGVIEAEVAANTHGAEEKSHGYWNGTQPSSLHP